MARLARVLSIIVIISLNLSFIRLALSNPSQASFLMLIYSSSVLVRESVFMDFEQIKKLQEINNLLDQKNSEIGVRSLSAAELNSAESDYSRKIDAAFKPEKALRIDEIYNGSSSTLFETANTGELSFISKVGIFSLLIILFLLVINADIRTTTLKLINLAPEIERGEKVSFAKAGTSKKIMKVIDLQDREVIIASGSFRTRYEAEKAFKELSKLAGKSLKIVKANGYYTIQFGPEYKDYDDAMLVFKELVKYQIKDLSIKVK